MSALSMIRSNMALIVIVIAIALLGFILTDLFSAAGQAIGGPPDMGTIAGKTISYNQFTERLEQYTRNNPSNTELSLSQSKDQAWNDLVNEIVFDEEFKKIGLQITDDEVLDLLVGPHQDPAVQRNFPGMDGNQILQQLKAIKDNPDYRGSLIDFETYLVRNRGVTRLTEMVKSGFVGSNALGRQKYVDQNRKADISFLAINYTQIPDSTVEISDSDVADYIEENAARFKQEEETVIRYAKFEILPDAADSTRARQNAIDWIENFAATPSDSVYTSNRSSLPYSPSNPNYQPISNQPAGVQDSLATAQAGDIIGPVMESNPAQGTGFYKLYKVVSTQDGEFPSLKFRHIQFTPAGRTAADSTKARSDASSLKAKATAANFDSFKDQYTIIESGWFRRGQFGIDFDDAIKNAQPGQVLGPIKGNLGYHVVVVDQRVDNDFSLAQVESSIRAGEKTKKRIYQEANQFAAAAQRAGNIDDAAAELDVVVDNSNSLTSNTNQIIGIQGGRKVVLWAINADVGDMPEKIFSVENNYVYAQVSDRKSEGLKSVAEVTNQIRPLVLNKKKAEMIKAQLKNYAGQDLNAMKTAYGDGAFINSATGISFESPSINGIGSDNLIIGRVMGLGEGQISEPLEGANGVFVVQVTKITEAGEPDEATISSNRNSEVVRGQSDLNQRLRDAMVEAAGVEDERAKAYAKLEGYR